MTLGVLARTTRQMVPLNVMQKTWKGECLKGDIESPVLDMLHLKRLLKTSKYQSQEFGGEVRTGYIIFGVIDFQGPKMAPKSIE